MNVKDKVAKCYRLAREFPDGVTNKNLRDLAAELEHQIRDLDRQSQPHTFEKDPR